VLGCRCRKRPLGSQAGSQGLHFGPPVLSPMEVLRAGRDLAAPTPRVRRTPVPRTWFTTAAAAAMLGVSDRTLRRRITRSSWVEGMHYRWITRQSRRTLEINVSSVIKLMDACGWG
jgi:hypothetical protein